MKTQKRIVSQPLEHDKNLDEYSVIIQDSLAELYQDSHVHDPADSGVLTTIIYQTGGSSTQVAHGDLSGLSNDDHTQYSKVDGTRDFTGVIAGVTPVGTTDLTTKAYVDDKIAASGNALEHGSLTGLTDDDHTQYSRVDGTRPYTDPVGGIWPAASGDLSTRGYVDNIVAESGALIAGSIDLTAYVPYTGATADVVIGENSFIDTNDGTVVHVSGYVSSIALSSGRTLAITRDSDNLISTIADGTRTWTYSRNVDTTLSGWAVT